MERRDFLKTATGVGAVSLAAAFAQTSRASQEVSAPKRSGKFKQSVTHMTFGASKDFEANCRAAAAIGFKGFDLANPVDWPTLKKYGLIPSISPGTIPRILPAAQLAAPPPPQPPAGSPKPSGPPASFNVPAAMNLCNKEQHDEQEKLLCGAIDQCADNGAPNVIVFSGTRLPGQPGISNEEAADNCVAILNRVKGCAEKKGVNICLEYLNSKVNHRGTIFDHLDWGLDVMKRVNSPRVGILFDIYHVQVDDGDVTRAMRDNLQWIKHIHTAGNPGRNQLDDNQELNYRFIARALAEMGYDGWIGHEYTPTKDADPIACLKQAFDIFNI
jgi:hydroxypyruvate isomerase